MKPTDCKPGTRVSFPPIRGGPRFIGIVRREPWQLGHGAWVTHLDDMESAYGDFVGRPAETTVHAALVDWLDPAPQVYPGRGDPVDLIEPPKLTQTQEHQRDVLLAKHGRD